MKEFKYRTFIVIKEWITLLFSSMAIGLIVYLFTSNIGYAGITGITLAILFTVIIFFEARQRIVIENGILKIYKGPKLKSEYDISACSFRARTATGGSNIGTDCKLSVFTQEGLEEWVDCTKIGVKQFEELLELLGFNDGPQEIEVIKKEKD